MNDLLKDYLNELEEYQLYKEERFLSRKTVCFDTDVPVVIYNINNKNEVLKKIDIFFGETEKEYKENAIIVKPKSLFEKTRFGFADLVEIIKRLRDPDGCPWDKVQTPETIRTNIIEEAYELVEAIELNDVEKIKEESGDLILQGLFVSVMEEDKGRMNPSDVITGLCVKLITRHTHIFGKDKATDAESALNFWEKAKAKEKGQKDIKDKLESVPKTFTALQRALKIQKIIKKTGFDFPEIQQALDKIKEEINEFSEAKDKEKEKEGGDILFSVVNVLRLYGIDPEVALNGTSKRFEKRFCYVVDKAEEQGRTTEQLTLEEMEKLYNESKKIYK